jgi:Predicted integral membrane proteins containing uncharacterized repeats
VQYTLTNLGPFLPFGLSPTSAHAVGSTVNPQIAAMLHPTVQSLGTLGGDQSRANGVYDDHVVGYASLGAFTHGFLWTPASGMQDLFTVDADDTTLFSAATAVNATGTICGYGDNPTRQTTIPLVWRGGHGFPVMLPTPNNSGHAYAVNDRGDIAGSANDAISNQTHASVWPSNGGFMDCHTTGNFSIAYGLNDALQVVGNTFTLTGARGFVWTAITGMELLNPLYTDTQSGATSINAAGVIVGSSSTPGATAGAMGHQAAVRWTNQTVEDLTLLAGNPVGWILLTAVAINTAGMILGQGVYHNARHAFLLTPLP